MLAPLAERQLVSARRDVCDSLFRGLSEEPNSVVALSHFTITGHPDFIHDSSGVMEGFNLDTTRGDILNGIIEGVTFSLKDVVDSLAPIVTDINECHPVGGGSKSEAWIRSSANIFGKPINLPLVKEAGTFGAANIAGVGREVYASFEEGVEASVRLERTFEPDMNTNQRDNAHSEAYKEFWPLVDKYLHILAAMN